MATRLVPSGPKSIAGAAVDDGTEIDIFGGASAGGASDFADLPDPAAASAARWASSFVTIPLGPVPFRSAGLRRFSSTMRRTLGRWSSGFDDRAEVACVFAGE